MTVLMVQQLVGKKGFWGAIRFLLSDEQISNFNEMTVYLLISKVGLSAVLVILSWIPNDIKNEFSKNCILVNGYPNITLLSSLS